MKLEKIEHNHKLTSILKVGLFAILMIMPFISALSKMCYVSWNKNAKDSYYGETINDSQLIDVTNTNQLVSGKEYKFLSDSQANNLTNEPIFFEITNVKNMLTNATLNFELEDIKYFRLTYYSTNYLLFLNDELTTIATYNITNQYTFNFDFTYIGSSVPNNTNIFNYAGDYLKYYEYNKYSFLDNVFYYANEQIWEEDIFSWVNTGLFANSLGAFIGVFGIAQNSYFNNLLTYWLVLIIIYIIIDLILGLFTLITHIICNRKVKE